MLDEPQREYVNKVTLMLQIITVAMATGVLVFAGVVMLLFQDDGQQDKDFQPLITYVAAAFGIVALLSATVVPRLMDANTRKNFLAGNLPQMKNQMPPAETGEVGLLVAMYQVRLIVGVAILEGAAFFNVIANMLEGQAISLAMVALLLVAIFFNFPTRSSIENWIAMQCRTIEELRSLQS
ncbi:MAG: hypothetical protein GXP26_01750 [Planctomycetes bacterium]|nr:hypothetical protein [Planctomycetota bacterium]